MTHESSGLPEPGVAQTEVALPATSGIEVKSIDWVPLTERTGTRPAVPPELAGLILHCLTNGLVNEHLADPESVTADVIERAFTAVLTALLPSPASS